MEAIKVRMKILSDTIKIPGLSKFIGKNVEIILLEDPSIVKKANRYSKLKRLKGKIHLGEKAVSALREKSKI